MQRLTLIVLVLGLGPIGCRSSCVRHSPAPPPPMKWEFEVGYTHHIEPGDTANVKMKWSR